MQKRTVSFIIAAALLLTGCRSAVGTVTTPTSQPASPTPPPPTAPPTLTPKTTTATASPTPLTPTPRPPTSPTPASGDVQTPPYGVVYPYNKSDWRETDRQAIHAQLSYLKSLGINTVVQIFSSRLIGSGREQDWLIFLDEAASVKMQVITRLWPLSNDEMDYPAIAAFLAVVQEHPAFLAYLGLHEPLERFNSNQLREFYSQVKHIAPDVPIANYMGTMAWFEKSLRFPNRDFTAGICDLCVVWYYPVRYRNGQPDFEADLLRETLRENRELMTARAPEAHLWVLGQVYAQSAHRRQLRMSTPEEMEQIYTIAMEEGADGFLWYPWFHGNYDEVLGNPAMTAQQQKVREIYETYVQPGATP